MVSGGEVASGRQGSSPAVKLPLGLGEAVECGWCESGFGLEIANTQGMQLWAVVSGRRGCARPYPHVKRMSTEETVRSFVRCVSVCLPLLACQLMAMFVFMHVVCKPLLATAVPPPPHSRERNDIHTHFLFEGSGQARSPGSPETSGMWDTTRLQQATSLKDWLVGPSAESSFVLCEPVRRRWQLTFCSADFLSCPGQRVRQSAQRSLNTTPSPSHLSSSFSSSLPPFFLFFFSRHSKPHWSYFPPTDQL